MKILIPTKKLPRNNFPIHVAQKRFESNFVASFARAYEVFAMGKRPANERVCAREFQLNGLGIADFISIEWVKNKGNKQKPMLYAFEMKMNNWKRAISKAYRYKYYSNIVYTVLPLEEAIKAAKNIDIFRSVNIGLIGFEAKTGKLSIICSPKKRKPLNYNLYVKAVGKLRKHFKFLPTFETLQSPLP